MSRDVKLNKQLNKEDRAYLVARGAYGAALIERVDSEYGQDPASLPDPEPTQEVLSQNVADLQAENDALKAQLAALQGDGEEDEEDVPDYGSWLLEELQTEAGDRGLSKSGTKAEIAARLAEHDAAADNA